MNPFAYFFSRKRELLILGAIVVICALGSKMVSIDHWASLDYNVTGYSIWLAPICLVWMTAYTLVLYMRRIMAPSLWIMGIAGWLYALFLFWMVNLQ